MDVTGKMDSESNPGGSSEKLRVLAQKNKTPTHDFGFLGQRLNQVSLTAASKRPMRMWNLGRV